MSAEYCLQSIYFPENLRVTPVQFLSCGKYGKDFLLFQENNLFGYVDVNYTC